MIYYQQFIRLTASDRLCRCLELYALGGSKAAQVA